MTKPVHIAIDARPLSRNTGGIKRYLDCILEQMIQSDNFFFTLYSDGILPKKYSEQRENVNSRVVPINSKANKLLWQFYMHAWLKKDKPDVFWSPRHHIPWSISKKIPIVVTIHDVIWKTHPETLEWARLINEKLSMPHAIKRANKILSPSKATAEEINKHWPKAKNKIDIVQHGATEFPKLSNQEKPIQRNYILAVGTLEPRKNYIRLIQAFDNWASKNTNIDLVIAGVTGWGWKNIKNKLKQCKHQNRIHIVLNADDIKLASLYTHANTFIQVSLAEGFGMPIAEARQFGLPVVLSDIPVFREILNENVVWIKPEDISSICRGFELALKGYKTTPQFLLSDWHDISQLILTEFKQLRT